MTVGADCAAAVVEAGAPAGALGEQALVGVATAGMTAGAVCIAGGDFQPPAGKPQRAAISRCRFRPSELFLLAFSLRFHRLRSALVIVSDPPHDRIGVLALEVLGDAENFLGTKTPIV